MNVPFVSLNDIAARLKKAKENGKIDYEMFKAKMKTVDGKTVLGGYEIRKFDIGQ